MAEPKGFDDLLNYLSKVRVEDVQALLTEPKVTRIKVARAYALLLAENWPQLSTLNVAELNRAILAKWSISGLEWIKREAWAIAQGKR